MRLLPALIAIAFASAPSNAATTQHCMMTDHFEQHDPDGSRKVLTSPGALAFSATMRVDADGGPHAYSAKDPAGRLCDPKVHPENAGKDPIVLGCAMDSLCDGASIETPQHDVFNVKSCPALLKTFELIRSAKWKPPVGYKINPIGIEMETPTRPCLDADETYIVSPSSTPSGIDNGWQCDQSRYVDTMVPTIVVPKCWSDSYRNDPDHPEHKKDCAEYPGEGIVPGIEVGNLVALLGRKTGKPMFGVIGDLGPNNKLGEASIGMLMTAAGWASPPSYLRATNSLDSREQFDVVILKGTRYAKPLIGSNVTDMTTAAQNALTHWGGTDFASAVGRLAACGREASP